MTLSTCVGRLFRNSYGLLGDWIEFIDVDRLMPETNIGRDTTIPFFKLPFEENLDLVPTVPEYSGLHSNLSLTFTIFFIVLNAVSKWFILYTGHGLHGEILHR